MRLHSEAHLNWNNYLSCYNWAVRSMFAMPNINSPSTFFLFKMYARGVHFFFFFVEGRSPGRQGSAYHAAFLISYFFNFFFFFHILDN